MPQPTYQYRGYIVGLHPEHGPMLVSVSPTTPDLPILRRYLFEIAAQTELEAMAEAKARVDKILAS
jgi:hypothetical protein